MTEPPVDSHPDSTLDDNPLPDGNSEAGVELLLFALGDEWYGLPVEQVAGVEPWRAVARLPGTSPSVLGLALWHGEVIPVLDPTPLLTGTSSSAEDGYLVIGRAPAGPVGLAVRAVAAVATADRRAIDAPLSAVDPSRARLVYGHVQVEGRWVALLALASLVDAAVGHDHERA
ncbi:MAG: chemotaxis protein CheW [Chloroflexi bacterium]|nr:chemotaxis protein CheW [Chloroflexota bacterium]